jgi:hypothetical protein
LPRWRREEDNIVFRGLHVRLAENQLVLMRGWLLDVEKHFTHHRLSPRLEKKKKFEF